MVLMPTHIKAISPRRVNMLSSIPCIFWGLGALTWVPLSLIIGRRAVFLICTILLTLSTLTAAVSQTFYLHLLARCLQGAACSISPSTVSKQDNPTTEFG
jgi:MFS family permease